MPKQSVVIGNRGDGGEARVMADTGIVQAPMSSFANWYGWGFQIHHVGTTAAATHNMHIHTGPNTSHYHLAWNAEVDGPGLFALREAATVAATGAAVDVICTQRRTPATAVCDAYYGSTIAGATMMYERSESAGGKFAPPGSGADVGWWLAPDTDYILEFVGDAAAVVSWELELCEVS